MLIQNVKFNINVIKAYNYVNKIKGSSTKSSQYFNINVIFFNIIVTYFNINVIQKAGF